MAQPCMWTLPGFGGVVALKLAQFKCPELFFLFGTHHCVISSEVFVDTVVGRFFLIKNVDCVYLLVVIVCAFKFLYSVMGCKL